MDDDAHLLRRYAEDRSEADFTAWVQRRFDLVYSAALRQLQGDHHRAREVAQAVFVDAARKAGSLSCHPAVVGWLYTSAHFAAQKMIRAESRRQIREGTACALEGAASPSADSWDSLRPYLDAEMLALGAADRTALLLRFFDQRPLAEVGSELGLSEGAARMRVERAVAKLRQRLARRGVTSSAAALAAALAGNAVVAAPAGLGAAVAANSLAEMAALAGGGAALAPLMASKFTIGVAAACGLLALGSGVYYSRQARTSGQSLLALERDCSQLEAGLRSIAGARGPEREPARALPPGTTRQPGEKSGAAEPAGGGNDRLYGEMAENPHLRLAYAKYFLADFRLKYGALGQTQGWSAEQVDQLGRLELKVLSDRFDLEQAARLIGKDPADPTLAAMEDRVREAGRAAEAGVVGPVGLQQLREYDRAYAAQEVVRRVAAGSFYGTTPLTTAQAGTLTQLLTQASPAFQQGGRLEWDTIDWENVLAQAGGSLPARQVEALRAVRADWQRRNLADAADAAAVATP